MPCGPLQAMQLYALTTGSVMQGALSMFLYSLGTIPLMFGFGAFLSMINKDYLKKIVKFSGIVIIILALFMFNRGLSNFGLGLKSLTAKDSFSQSEYELVGDIQEFQTVKMDVAYTGYKPNVLYVKKDVPVRWIINAEQITGCIDEIIMPDYNIKKPLKKGENIVEFTPTKTGEVKFSCWMQMVWGKFIVYEGDQLPNASDISVEDIQPSSCSGNGNCGGTCGQGTCDCKIIKPN